MKTSADSRVLFDTNVLVYALDTDAPQHEAAKIACGAAAAGQFPAFITTQIVFEYVSSLRVPSGSPLLPRWQRHGKISVDSFLPSLCFRFAPRMCRRLLRSARRLS
jgi:predicted nucleic acid-binding protein